MRIKIYLLLICLFFLTSPTLKAQSTLSTLSSLSVTGGQRGISFNVHATNAITLTEIGTASTNGSLTFVEIWYNTTGIFGAPTINQANGWVKAGGIPAMNIASGAAAVTSLPIPLTINIPMGATYGFFIGCASGAIGYKNYAGGATTFSDPNASIETGSNIGYSGAAPTPVNTISQFTGSIKYYLSGGPVVKPVANLFPGVASGSSSVTDTVWINSPYKMYATSALSTRSYWQLPGTTGLNPGYSLQLVQYEPSLYIDTAKYNSFFKYTFNSRGFKAVKILSINEADRSNLRDSVTKYIWVDTPNVKPVANFNSGRLKIGIGDYAVMNDLSLQGPTQWYWTFSPPCNLCAIQPYFNNFFAGPTDQNPLFFGGDPGVYTVCLQTWNARGWDTICKKDYIEVLNSISICSGSGASSNSEPKGYLFGPAGPGISYSRTQISTCPGFLLAPCADSIFLFVDRIKMLPSCNQEWQPAHFAHIGETGCNKH